MPEQLLFDVGTIIEIFLFILGIAGVLIGVIWTGLKEKIKKLETKIDELQKKDIYITEQIHTVEHSQMVMMQTIIKEYITKEDCMRISEKKSDKEN